MGNLQILFIALTVFGVGVTTIDFLGLLGGDDGASNDNSSEDSFAEDAGSPAKQSGSRTGSNLGQGHTGIRALSFVMSILRTAVYFSLGFGPMGLFAMFLGLPQSHGLLWAFGGGFAILILARFLRRFIKRDLDSSIVKEEFTMETGTLLLPLEGGGISKMLVRKFGKVTELYVKSKDTNVKLCKGKTVRIVDYDEKFYWVEPAE